LEVDAMATVTTPRNARQREPRKPLPPVPVTGSFVGGPPSAHDLLHGVAVLEVLRPEDSDYYWTAVVADAGRVVGYQLAHFGTGTVYFLPADLSECDCPDRTYRPERPGGCKHMRGLAQALAARRAPYRKTERDEITSSEAA
jgi:hypothetical protein